VNISANHKASLHRECFFLFAHNICSFLLVPPFTQVAADDVKK
jgi:hypothetical protein